MPQTLAAIDELLRPFCQTEVHAPRVVIPGAPPFEDPFTYQRRRIATDGRIMAMHDLPEGMDAGMEWAFGRKCLDKVEHLQRLGPVSGFSEVRIPRERRISLRLRVACKDEDDEMVERILVRNAVYRDRIGVAIIDPFYVRRIERLPEVRVFGGMDPHEGLLFTFTAGVGMVLPLRPTVPNAQYQKWHHAEFGEAFVEPEGIASDMHCMASKTGYLLFDPPDGDENHGEVPHNGD